MYIKTRNYCYWHPCAQPVLTYPASRKKYYYYRITHFMLYNALQCRCCATGPPNRQVFGIRRRHRICTCHLRTFRQTVMEIVYLLVNPYEFREKMRCPKKESPNPTINGITAEQQTYRLQ